MEQKQKEDMPEKSVKITVNGTDYYWEKELISYSEILALIGYGVENEKKFDVQYSGALGRGEESGILMYRSGEEESVKVKEGTLFKVKESVDS